MTDIDRATDDRPTAFQDSPVWEAAVQAAMRLLAVKPLHEVRLEHVAAHIGVPIEAVREQIPDLTALLVASIQRMMAAAFARARASIGGRTAADAGAIPGPPRRM